MITHFTIKWQPQMRLPNYSVAQKLKDQISKYNINSHG